MLRKVGITVVLLVASAVAFFGVRSYFTGTIDKPAAETRVSATLSGLTASVGSADWVMMDHDMSSTAPGYQMPPAMMPGMPAAGEQRLEVLVTVVNTTSDTRPLRPGKEFQLRTESSDPPLAPHSDTFGELPRLAPGSAVSGVLYFDLPPHSPSWLEWTHEGMTARLAIGVAPPHSNHG
ncbi:DUF4352 domain-containing protein [Actinocrispum wychmicini]|uniref:Uncharacterized protein DUF4352 n=1 Tax=Actinocrispum wychmicini TaxID=1213861 RepID=A0A4R2IPP6_9PSEU|nr:DUF4352 domain-containing protein [Actinocrispum wychmicini]TCO46622.1 uncharacterized protein DUF4352 [Actinocrispum wychmicini]